MSFHTPDTPSFFPFFFIKTIKTKQRLCYCTIVTLMQPVPHLGFERIFNLFEFFQCINRPITAFTIVIYFLATFIYMKQ